jgi:hypothetical protein
MPFEEGSSEDSNRKDDNFELDVMLVSFYIGHASSAELQQALFPV